ncbi:MAG: DUF1566 domain-containing protein [bacterium]
MIDETVIVEKRKNYIYANGSYKANDDGTVSDETSGLMWQQETAGPMSWEEALRYCEGLTLGGYSDWRLPNINELQFLVDYSRYNPAINPELFPTTQASGYWSSTVNHCSPDNAWYVGFDYGWISYGSRGAGKYNVRAVRSGRLLGDLVICTPEKLTLTYGNGAFNSDDATRYEMIGDRAVASARPLGAKLCLKVDWLEDKGKVKFTDNCGNTLEISPDRITSDDRAWVKVRDVAEHFGWRVDWNVQNRIVTVSPLKLTSPSNNATFTVGDIVKLSATAPGVATAKFWVSNISTGWSDNPGGELHGSYNYSVNWSTIGLDSGWYLIRGIGYDSSQQEVARDEAYVRLIPGRLPSPKINQPAKDVTLPLGDITVQWNSVPGAVKYWFNIRDINRNKVPEWFHDNELSKDKTSYKISAENLSKDYEVDKKTERRYRVAVAAVPQGALALSDALWSEVEFTVKFPPGSLAKVEITEPKESGKTYNLRDMIIRWKEVAGASQYAVAMWEWEPPILVRKKQRSKALLSSSCDVKEKISSWINELNGHPPKLLKTDIDKDKTTYTIPMTKLAEGHQYMFGVWAVNAEDCLVGPPGGVDFKIASSTILIKIDTKPPSAYPEDSWYLGDCHVHTNYKGKDNPINEDKNKGVIDHVTVTLADRISQAQSIGLNFLITTDHRSMFDHNNDDNYYAGIRWQDYASACNKSNFLVIPGVEFSIRNPKGGGDISHCLAYGLAADKDLFSEWWRLKDRKEAYTHQEIINKINEHNPEKSFAVIAHPYQNPSWNNWNCENFNGIQLLNNEKMADPNTIRIRKWFDLLRDRFVSTVRGGEGFVVGIGGTDSHYEYNDNKGFTWVYTSDFSRDGILKAIRAGRVSVSGRKENFGAFSINSRPQGDVVKVSSNDTLNWKWKVKGDWKDVTIYDYDRTTFGYFERVERPEKYEHPFTTSAPQKDTFYVVRFRYTDGSDVWTNPIFVDVESKSSSPPILVRARTDSLPVSLPIELSLADALLTANGSGGAAVQGMTISSFDCPAESLPPSGYISDIYYFNADDTDNISISNIRLTITYNDSDLYVNPSRLTIYQYDPMAKNWVELPSTIDTTLHTVTANPYSLGIFVLSAYDEEDFVAPDIAFEIPTDGVILCEPTTVKVRASDYNGVIKVRFYIDGVWFEIDNFREDGWSTTFDPHLITAGTHTLTAEAFDAAGNSSQAEITISIPESVAAMSPVVSITSPANNAGVSGQIALTGTVTAASMPEIVAVVDETPIGWAEIDDQGRWTIELDTTMLDNGQHTISILATDSMGAQGTASLTITIANQYHTYYQDADGDGYGDPNRSITALAAPAGYVDKGGDCQDSDANINPAASEVCDNKDNDCDGLVDENLAKPCSTGCGSGTETCQAGRWVGCTAPQPRPETCDGKDNDCDGLVDEGLARTYYLDADGDWYGDASESLQACSPPSGYVEDGTDCDDQNGAVHENCGSSQPPESQAACQEDNSGALDVVGAKGKPGDEVEIAVRIQGAPWDVYSFGFELTYDPEILEYREEDYKLGELAASLPLFGVREISSGKIKVAGIDPSGGSITEGASGTVVVLKFEVRSGIQGGECYPLGLEALDGDITEFSATGGCLCVECQEQTSGVLDVVGTTGSPGDEVEIPIRIQGAPDAVSSFGFEFTYKPNVLEYSGYEKGDLPASFPIFEVIELGSGRLKIGGLDPYSGISEGASGTVAVLKFKVKEEGSAGHEGECYPLRIEKPEDTISQFAISGGCFCIETCTGDLTGDGIVTPSDALIVFRCYLGITPCPECADVDKSGHVSPADALCLFRKYLGMVSCLD